MAMNINWEIRPHDVIESVILGGPLASSLTIILYSYTFVKIDWLRINLIVIIVTAIVTISLTQLFIYLWLVKLLIALAIPSIFHEINRKYIL